MHMKFHFYQCHLLLCVPTIQNFIQFHLIKVAICLSQKFQKKTSNTITCWVISTKIYTRYFVNQEHSFMKFCALVLELHLHEIFVPYRQYRIKVRSYSENAEMYKSTKNKNRKDKQFFFLFMYKKVKIRVSIC